MRDVRCPFLHAGRSCWPYTIQLPGPGIPDAVGSDGSIFVIIGAFKFVDMIPFGLEFLSGKRSELCTQIEVIGIIPVCCELEFSGHEGFQFRAHARTYSQQAERFSFRCASSTSASSTFVKSPLLSASCTPVRRLPEFQVGGSRP